VKDVSILAITKNGLKIGSSLKKDKHDWIIYAPEKFSSEYDECDIEWFVEPTSLKIVNLFKSSKVLICLFSLGAVIRLIAPHIKDKKTDPAVIVIDDKSNFVISALSGHIGGANKITQEIAKKINAIPVITTAADVNKTIAVDLVGRELGWEIDDDSTVTKISAMMVNEEKIGIFQDAGKRNWWNSTLPKNVLSYSSLEDLEKSKSKGCLIISDKLLKLEILKDAVVYRPKSLIVGVGLHWNTSKEKIKECITKSLKKFELSEKSIAAIASIKKPKDVEGLIEFGREEEIPVKYVSKEDLAKINIPNPSQTVNRFEGTPSVSEAAALFVSQGELIIEKQKFPPDLTIAVARIKGENED
jgi:cobalt-precorrin 5A hydrolase